MWHAICNTVKSASNRLIMKDVYLSRRRCLQVSAFVYSLSAPLLPFGRSFWQCRLCRVVHPEERIKGVGVLKEIESLCARDAVDDEVKNFEAGRMVISRKRSNSQSCSSESKHCSDEGRRITRMLFASRGWRSIGSITNVSAGFLITLTKRLHLPKGVAQK
jgi:hypothetical protein